MKINNPISGMMETERDYILDVTSFDGKNTGIGPFPGDKKYSIVIGKGNSGNVFTFSPTVLTGDKPWLSTP